MKLGKYLFSGISNAITSSLESNDWSPQKMLVSFGSGILGAKIGNTIGKGVNKITKYSANYFSKSLSRLGESFSGEFIDGLYDSGLDFKFALKYASKATINEYSSTYGLSVTPLKSFMLPKFLSKKSIYPFKSLGEWP